MKKNFWQDLPKPIIGLAPMDGYSDSAYRRICKTVNANIVTITEFTSADGLHFNADKLREKLSFHADERPVIAQIFGKNRETFISATKICEEMGFDGVDINMGCPSKKVVRSEHGVALRKNPELAFELIDAVASNTSLPVSVKTRLGWKDASDLISFARGAEKAGANMICIHARTYLEPYNVPAQFEPVYELKRNVGIPVLGNGGITSLPDGMAKLGNLDGFLIGQGSFGNPWIFGEEAPKTFSEKVPLIKNHVEWLIEHKGNTKGTREIRKHLLSYIRGFRFSKQYRSQLARVGSQDEIFALLDDICKFEKMDTYLPPQAIED
ncbi:MAG: tRNA-dihydrouridine synthase B [Candidatus Marinamargulisbacteria bacterium]|jgi:tRNA-dihydrouridine synthase B